MKAFRRAFVTGSLSLALVAPACAADKQPAPRAPASSASAALGPSEHEIELANDPHRRWWEAYHPNETYRAATALAAHRLYCQDHSADSTCTGWDWH